MSGLFPDLDLSTPPKEVASAILSPCGTYRYTLTRTWAANDEPLVLVMLNPSTADASQDDPTIRRVRTFTKAAGYGGFVVVNLFAYRSTDPKALRGLVFGIAVGPDNDEHIVHECIGRSVVCAWGANRTWGREKRVLELLRAAAAEVLCLGLTKYGAPLHPLMIPSGTPLVPYEGRPK